MALEVAGDVEQALAVWALMWFLARMGEGVGQKLTGPREPLFALIALVALVLLDADPPWLTVRGRRRRNTGRGAFPTFLPTTRTRISIRRRAAVGFRERSIFVIILILIIVLLLVPIACVLTHIHILIPSSFLVATRACSRGGGGGRSGLPGHVQSRHVQSRLCVI